jgi:hypothetical protein
LPSKPIKALIINANLFEKVTITYLGQEVKGLPEYNHERLTFTFEKGESYDLHPDLLKEALRAFVCKAKDHDICAEKPE